MKKTIPLFQVDAFTRQPFSGNPAAVCLLDSPRDKTWMQSVAAEMNLSETAFVQRAATGFELRWFTPTTEVDLCGHATLATAHVLWQQDYLAKQEQAEFHTRSGLLVARKNNDKITLDFPGTPTKPIETPAGLLAALGLTKAKVFSNQVDYLVQLDDAATVRDLEPDFVALANIETRGVIVTALSDNNNYDFISRFFAPAAGIPEDPVTGSAHCTLAPFWAEQLQRNTLRAYQASPRGGEIEVELQDERVYLTGNAITVFEGVLHV